MNEKMSVLEESYQWAQKQGRCITPNIRQTNQEILHAIGSLKTSLGVGGESKSLAAIPGTAPVIDAPGQFVDCRKLSSFCVQACLS